MKYLVLFLFAFIYFIGYAENDPLHKRRFHASFTEVKNGVVAKKPIADLIEFKNGKLNSGFLHKKFGFKWIRYRINTDTMYTDYTGADVRELQIEAVATDESNLTAIVNLEIIEWDIEGTVRITKNDKLRRYYDLVGMEKGGKPRRVKKAPEPLTEAL